MSINLNFSQEIFQNKMQKINQNDFPESWELYKIHGEALVTKHNFFLADGEKTVKRLLLSQFKIKEIICLEKYLTVEFENLLLNHPEIERILIGTPETLRQIRGYDLHQGIMALASLPDLAPKLDPPIFVGNSILEANNWGSLIRSLSALGIKSLVFDKASCHPYIRRSVRVSLGAIFQMSLFYTSDLKEFLVEYLRKGFQVFGSGVPKTNKKVISSWDWKPPLESVV
ncbi:MAG: hypothetical protein N3A69_09405, partial [Leptospiraceae bacterium]|nr:hypothetical protein [Leptospiraceae bacterium]